MQPIFVDITISGLLVFLFGAITRVRPDNRLRCWVAAWLCIVAHFVEQLWYPGNVFENVPVAVTVALAGACFIVSTTILPEGLLASLFIGFPLVLLTTGCIILANMRIPAWLLIAAILLRAGGGLWSILRTTPQWFSVKRPVAAVVLLATGIAIYGAWSSQPRLVSAMLLSELYIAAGGFFWTLRSKRRLAVVTTIIGLVTWGAMFPAQYLLQEHWPRVAINHQVWCLPAVCAGVGMILLVAEEQLFHASLLGQEYRMLFQSNPHPMWILDSKRLNLLDVNEAALEALGYTRDQFLALRLSTLLPADRAIPVIEDIKYGRLTSYRALPLRRADSSRLAMDITPSRTEFRGQDCYFMLAIDVSQREQLEQQLAVQAQHDALTGIPNRRAFDERLGDMVRAIQESGEKLALLCIDLRRFKRINDVYGLRVGDECIRYVARILNTCKSERDLLARTGGDEFALVFTGIRSAAVAEQAASELRSALSEPVMIQGFLIQLSFCIGMAICPDDSTDAVALWRGAESMLRRAQKEGNGEILWLSPDRRQDAEEQIAIESAMRSDFEQSGFHLVYQPVYDFSGRMCGLEALLRLNHPLLGFVSPAKVIPVAEETGLIVPLGLWVIEQSCRQSRAWMDAGMRMVPIAINVSALQLMHIDFAERVIGILQQYEVAPDWIHLELTESAAMRNVKEVSGQMAQLAALGISFSIDDFGTGQSSLARLHQLPLSVLKIDRSFVQSLFSSSGTHTTLPIVQAIISMAHALEQKVIAEGVETSDQLEWLEALGCDMVQGFYLSRPVPPAKIPDLAANIHSAFTGTFPPRRPASSEIWPDSGGGYWLPNIG